MGANAKKSYYYAVQNGRSAGVYNSWAECESNVKGFKGAVYKKFDTEQEARDYARTPATGDRSIGTIYHSEPSYQREIPVVRSTNSYSTNNNYASHAAKVSSTPYINRPKTTPQPAKRKIEDTSYRTEYKQRKFEHSEPQHSLHKTSVVYTDGASSNNGRGNARAGFGVYWGDNDPRNASIKLPGEKQTNQRAEASAVIHALEQSLDGTDTLEIRTDSQYVINAADSWSKKWVKNNWKSSNGKDVENKDLFKKMLDLREKRKGDVKFVYVPGHKGVEGNEKADQLAVAGARK